MIWLARVRVSHGRFRMRNRFALMGALALGTTLLFGQAPQATKPAAKSTAKTFKVARTPEGVPDLQGFWTNSTLTPLERPKALGSKEFYTAEEVAAAQKKDKDRLALDLSEGLPTEKGTAADVHYDFAQFGLDKAQSSLVWDRANFADYWTDGPDSRAAAGSAQKSR